MLKMVGRNHSRTPATGSKPASGALAKYVAAAAATCVPASAALAAWELNMPRGVTELSREIHGLHMLILWICVIIAVAVFGAMFYSIIKFRHSQGAVPATFDHSTRAEIIWTIIPVAILIGMAIPAAATLVKIEDTRGSELTVKVTGYQWKWHYDYLDQKVSFFSTLARDSDAARQLDSGIAPESVPNYLLEVDHPLVVPAGAKVRVLLTAADVIHAWWVPAFGMKKDAVPGFVNELWFRADEPGIYRGQCAELCGRDHGFMPVVVDVRSKEDFDRWLAQQQGGAQAAQATDAAQAAPDAAQDVAQAQ
jgi:cytochrome c oxidase subunit II